MNLNNGDRVKFKYSSGSGQKWFVEMFDVDKSTAKIIIDTLCQSKVGKIEICNTNMRGWTHIKGQEKE